MRKQERVTIDNPASRDHGKTFVITEKPASEAWSISQDLFRMMGETSFLSIPDDVVLMGCAGLATVGKSVLAASGSAVSNELLARMFDDVNIAIENDGKTVERAVNIKADIEEIDTINQILDRAFYINFAFLKTDRE
ncbi:hypothetical protein AB2842_000813 [Morganella morganii]|nr:hypothetical protein [Morganella morganii]HCR3760426.1 hypothetical protein [Morganella morganii]